MARELVLFVTGTAWAELAGDFGAMVSFFLPTTGAAWPEPSLAGCRAFSDDCAYAAQHSGNPAAKVIARSAAGEMGARACDEVSMESSLRMLRIP